MRFSPAYEQRQSILKNMSSLSSVLEKEKESGYTDEEDLSSRSNPEVSDSVPEMTSRSTSEVTNEKVSDNPVYVTSNERASFQPGNFQRRFSYTRWLTSSTQSESVVNRKMPASQALNLNKAKPAAKRKIEVKRNERSSPRTKAPEAKIKESLKKKKLEERISQDSEVERSKVKVRKKPWEQGSKLKR